MSANIVNWILANIVYNSQVLQSIIALVILLFAGFWLSDKSKEKNLFRSRRVLGGLIFVFAIFLFLYANIADLADVFTVWATLVLAGIAILSFEESRRLRKQYEEREERDRKERLLNEIIEWATNVAKCGIEPGTPDLSDDKGAAKSWPFLDTQFKKLDDLQLLRARSVSVDGIARRIDTGLQASVNDSIANLRNQLRALYDYKGFMNEHKHKETAEKVDFLINTGKKVSDNNKLLYESAVKVIEEATQIKVKGIT